MRDELRGLLPAEALDRCLCRVPAVASHVEIPIWLAERLSYELASAEDQLHRLRTRTTDELFALAGENMILRAQLQS